MYYGIESIIFKSKILNQQFTFELPDFEKDCEEIVTYYGYRDYFYGNLVIENYPRLEILKFDDASLASINSATICNNNKLKSFETLRYSFRKAFTLIMNSK